MQGPAYRAARAFVAAEALERRIESAVLAALRSDRARLDPSDLFVIALVSGIEGSAMALNGQSAWGDQEVKG